MKIQYKGEEVEITETEVIEAVRDEYAKKEQAQKTEIDGLKAQQEEELKKMREEHAKQIRAILTTPYEPSAEEKEQEQEKSAIEEASKRIIARMR